MNLYGELKGAQFENVATLPANAPDGRVVRLTTDGFYYVSDGTNWTNITEKEDDKTENIAALDIDWSLGKVFKKFIDVNTAFTFSNLFDRTITVVITETDSKTVTWPAYVVWEAAGAPTQTVLKTDVYEFKYVDGNIYGKRIRTACVGGWPYGLLGDLTVGAGITTELPGGEIYDYDNVTVAATGILRFTGDTTAWTRLGVKTNITVAGTIECKGSTAVGVNAIITPDNISVTNTITQKNGGAAGIGGWPFSLGVGGAAGAQSAGKGGGGGGGGSYTAAHYASTGGAGGSGTIGSDGTGTGAGTGGALGATTVGSNGAVALGGNGGKGDSGGGGGGDALGVKVGGGGGGGGGNKGTHGKNLYIRCGGTFDGTDGTITVEGSNGVAGGNGGNGDAALGGAAGGGGGGGAGGSAGKLVIRLANAPWSGGDVAPTMTVTGGGAGAGGTKGVGFVHGTNPPADGSAGTAGDAGSTDVLIYP